MEMNRRQGELNNPQNSKQSKPAIYILGTRGIPASHGGFETFAERFALHMVERGWDVTCYCQVENLSYADRPLIDYWRGVRRVTFAAGNNAFGTMKFDLSCVRHALNERGVMLVLGYNTAIFSAFLRTSPNPVLTNMDGIEWKRAKWPWFGKLWFLMNECIGALSSTKLIADHPEIAIHLTRWRRESDITMIPYGADRVVSAPEAPVLELGLTPRRYVISIGRIEPENNILPMISGYSRKSRTYDFVCLGKLEPDRNRYHAAVIAAGKDRVKFPGAIYEADRVKSLRFHALAYCHGHSVGGTNPSLVEALGVGNPILAHDNQYNKWVAGADQLFFADEGECAQHFDALEAMEESDRKTLSDRARQRFESNFQWLPVLEEYRMLCVQHSPAAIDARSIAGTA